MDIQITFINQSQENHPHVAICQKNLVDGTVTAWQVIKCGRHNEHSFLYTLDTDLATEDDYGNESDLVQVANGQKWDALPENELRLDSTPASNRDCIEVKNGLSHGAIDALLYKDEKILATRIGIAPGQVAGFAFNMEIWLGIVPKEVEEGELLSPSLLTTMISLMGLTKANIIMTGGGTGSSAKPVVFNVVPEV